MNKTPVIKTVLILLLISGCNTHENYKNELTTNSMINKSELSSLEGKAAYFGHQSVGINIIDGLKSLIIKNNDLNFIKIISHKEYLSLKIPENDSSFYFIHSFIGENGFPETKLEDFQNKLDTLTSINAAFLKFCFVDIDRNTDVNVLYNNYINKIKYLEGKHNNIKFVYFTIPVTAKRNYFVLLAKTILGRPDYSYKRNQINKLLRETDNINLFDLAYLETNSENYKKENIKEHLLKEYASDAGHLNSIGSEKVALELLIHLNSLFEEQ